MKTLKQLLRQPLKTIFGVILMSLATACLCIGVGQQASAEATAQMLEESFSSVAVHSPTAQVRTFGLSTYHSNDILNELSAWTKELSETRPDVVKEIASHGLASAYISGLNPVGYYEQPYFRSSNSLLHHQPTPFGAPWSCAMFQITLNEIGNITGRSISAYQNVTKNPWEFPSYDEYNAYLESEPLAHTTTGYNVEIKGTIDQVISLQKQFKNPTGMFVRLSYTVPTLEEAQKFVANLAPGEKYVVYGMDYYDEDYELRDTLKRQLTIDQFDMSKMRPMTDAEKANYPIAYAWVYKGLPLTEFQYAMANTVSLTLPSAYDLVDYDIIRDEEGKLLEFREITQRTITEKDGTERTVTVEEFDAHYQIPNIAHLEGSVEDFLASHADWAELLNQAQINNHAFPLVGVDNLRYVSRFADETAEIVEGRYFTREELESGAKVCVISQELALENGLTLGDMIHPNFYNADKNMPYQDTLAEGNGLVNPTASFYFSTTPLLGEESYTIVGIYRSESPWMEPSWAVEAHEDAGQYTFTPNVIFAPKNAISSEMQYSNQKFFETVVLQNGQMEAFEELARKQGYSGKFLCFDQGYSVIVGNFSDYQELSQQVMLICMGICAVISLLFLLLFPGSQRKHVHLMESMGARLGKRRRFIIVSSLGILLPAAVLGVGIGLLLWDRIVSSLLAAAEVSVALEADIVTIGMVAAAHLITVLLLTSLLSIWVARPRSLSARR